MQTARSEAEVFGELERLCASPGYIHALALLAFRDNFIRVRAEVTPDDLRRMYTPARLVRTEMSTLLGMLVKHDVSLTCPEPAALQDFVARTDALLQEMHAAMQRPMMENLTGEYTQAQSVASLTMGNFLREPIFYGGESAFSFQYIDFAERKYAADREWMFRAKGFDIKDACTAFRALLPLLEERLTEHSSAFHEQDPSDGNILRGFVVTANEVAERAMLDTAVAESVLQAFSVEGGSLNQSFVSVHDFNVMNATPILRLDDKEYAVFQLFALAEAIYESPFYWMTDDLAYRAQAMRHRGEFTERFCEDCLAAVFGRERTRANVEILDRGGAKRGEIDTLVFFGDRAIVLQAKSKRLTVEARKGNDGILQDDFKKAIQQSYEQARICAEHLIEGTHRLVQQTTGEVLTAPQLTEIYLVCIVSDHYPALSFQVRHFLKLGTLQDPVMPPLVTDVFALDAIAEMLHTPLRFLSYLNQRVKYADRLVASHEMTVLAYHLKQNLWVDEEHDLVMVDDSFVADLEVALTRRRTGAPGAATPDGVLTRVDATMVGKIISQLENRADSVAIDLGFLLLSLGEESIRTASELIERTLAQARADHRHHDVSVGLKSVAGGLTIHCNADQDDVAMERLQGHCRIRKYATRAKTWYGVCIDPRSSRLRFAAKLDDPWHYSEDMEAATKNLHAGSDFATASRASKKGTRIGRNSPCPCGSGIKYKKCCLGRASGKLEGSRNHRA